MKLVQNPICDKLADHRVLGAFAFILFVGPVALAIRDSHASARGAPGRPLAAGGAPSARRDEVSSDGLSWRSAEGSTLGSLDARKALGLDPDPPEKPREAPGDFFTDVSAAFDGGEASGLVRCRTNEEMGIFQRWRGMLRGRSLLESLTLRRIEQSPDGIERYQVTIKDANIEGWITFKQHRNRWYVVGVKEKKREKTEDEHDRELDKLLESLKIQGSALEDLHGPEPAAPPKER